jgi:H+/Cl- antiporter ClcA
LDHSEKFKRWQEFAKGKGWVGPSKVGLLPRLLVRVGINIPPEIFWPTWAIGIVSGLSFGILWGTFMYFIVWRDRMVSQVILVSALAGFCFGLFGILMHVFSIKKMEGLTWQRFISSLQK